MWSVKLANWHFWLGTLGIIFYAVPMYICRIYTRVNVEAV
ncbi:hypothetical protein [Chryseobacterium indoltheticum]